MIDRGHRARYALLKYFCDNRAAIYLSYRSSEGTRDKKCPRLLPPLSCHFAEESLPGYRTGHRYIERVSAVTESSVGAHRTYQ